MPQGSREHSACVAVWSRTVGYRCVPYSGDPRVRGDGFDSDLVALHTTYHLRRQAGAGGLEGGGGGPQLPGRLGGQTLRLGLAHNRQILAVGAGNSGGRVRPWGHKLPAGEGEEGGGGGVAVQSPYYSIQRVA